MISTIWAPTPRFTMLPVAEYVPISRSKPAPIYLSEILIVSTMKLGAQGSAH